MKFKTLWVLAGLMVGFGAWFIPTAKTAPRLLKAHADIQGVPGSGISGEALFVQTGDGIAPGVHVIVHVSGLPPDSDHGMHIHEAGRCEPPGFSTAGGHFDPGPFGSSTPVDTNHPYHMGDLDPVHANSAGNASIEYHTSRITLSPGPLSVFDANGSAIMIHRDPDQGTTGVPGGAGGPRIACGVIMAE